MNPTLRQTDFSAEQLGQLLPVGVLITDPDGAVTSFNNRAAELLGAPPVVGMPIPFTPLLNNTTEYITSPRSVAIERAPGDVIHLQHFTQPYYSGPGILSGTVHTLIDHSEEAKLKVLNDELKASGQRFNRMVEEVEDYAILLLDRSGAIQNWNTGAAKIKGYTEQEIIGKNFKIFYLPEDQEKGLPEMLIEQAVSTGKAVHEGWRIRKDKSRFWGSVVITALHNDEGDIIGFTKVTRDLSERKMAEDQIKKYASDLEFQNQELEQFAYAASHDLKEPIRKILFYNSYIADNFSEVLDARSQEYLSRSLSACKRMQQLIEDILSYTKTTVLLERYERVDLNDLIADIISLHHDDFEASSVTIHSSNLPVVSGIPFQLKQLFENLISNSIKYRHNDRKSVVKIEYALKSGSGIEVESIDPSKQYHNISVTDNGIGFDQLYATRIFEIFQRLQSRSHSAGSGIGLAICKRIVQNHQGFITATGIPNEGARFDIYLPVL